MSQSFDGVLGQSAQDCFNVQACGRHDGLLEILTIELGGQLRASPLNAFANQAETIGMHAIGAQAQYDVAWFDISSGENF